MLAVPVPSLSLGATVNGATAGQAFFAGSGGVLAQDSAFLWDATNHRLGVGGTPSVPLHVIAPNGTTAAVYVDLSAGSTGTAQAWRTSTGQLIADVTFAGSAPTLDLFNTSGGSCFQITTGGGVAQMGTVSSVVLSFFTGNATRWQIGTTGHFFPGATDNTYDIGQSGGRIRSLYAAATVQAGGFANAQATKTAAYTIAATDGTILGNATTAAFAVTLPAANAVQAGRRFTAKKIDTSANAVTLTAAGTDKIDGAATFALATQWKYVTVESDGSANWYLVANN